MPPAKGSGGDDLPGVLWREGMTWLTLFILAPVMAVLVPLLFLAGRNAARLRIRRKPPTVPEVMTDMTSALPGSITYVDHRHRDNFQFRSLGEEQLFYRGYPIKCFSCSIGEKCERHPT